MRRAARTLAIRAARAVRRLSEETLGRLDRMAGLPRGARDAGAATVEFALMLPLFMLTVASGIEASMLLSRQAMLERGLDIAAREVQLRSGFVVTDTELARLVCERAAILTDCQQNLLIEMRVVDPRSFRPPRGTPPCRRIDSTIVPPSAYDGAGTNQLVLVRACYAVHPMMPGSTLGVRLSDNPDGAYRLVTSKLFTVE